MLLFFKFEHFSIILRFDKKKFLSICQNRLFHKKSVNLFKFYKLFESFKKFLINYLEDLAFVYQYEWF